MSSESVLKEIEEAIEAVEAHSSAEVVVSLQDASAKYRDLDLLWGILLASVALLFLFYSPWTFRQDLVPLNVILSGLVGYGLSRWLSSLRRAFLTEKRAIDTVRHTAKSLLIRLGITNTRKRTGILIYVSRFEQRLTLVADLGVAAVLSETFFDELESEFGKIKNDDDLIRNILATLERLKGPLRRTLPRQEDDFNELPNRPVELS